MKLKCIRVKGLNFIDYNCPLMYDYLLNLEPLVIYFVIF